MLWVPVFAVERNALHCYALHRASMSLYGKSPKAKMVGMLAINSLMGIITNEEDDLGESWCSFNFHSQLILVVELSYCLFELIQEEWCCFNKTVLMLFSYVLSFYLNFLYYFCLSKGLFSGSIKNWSELQNFLHTTLLLSVGYSYSASCTLFFSTYYSLFVLW